MQLAQFDRKNFLLKSGSLLTVPLLKYCTDARLAGRSGNDPLQNAELAGYTEPALKAINFGITAPNAHNTQAWKFKLLNPEEFLLYVDESRLLPVTDIPARQIHISQGTFLEVMRIGAEGIGYKSEIRLFPEGQYSSAEIGKKPVAHVKLKKQDAITGPLFQAIKSRATNRTKYHGDLITVPDTESILKLAAPAYSSIRFILAEKMRPYFELLCDSMNLESRNFKLADESRLWFRFSDSEIQDKRDGIGLPGKGITGFTRWMAETFFVSADPKKFHDPDGTNLFLSRYKENVETSRGIVYWQTSANTMKDWVQTGFDYARFQLAITSLGYVMHPMSQLLQEYPEMNDLQKKFNQLTGVNAPAKIQMIVRLGRSDYQYLSPRRSAKSMLI
ncbi:MAG: hypothetical protein K8S54_06295 [Spirochaetia bacterium]|nr:hypothetical protein [Spirochaetia bacterium]